MGRFARFRLPADGLRHFPHSRGQGGSALKRFACTFLFVTLAITSLSGCWNLVEVDRRALVTTIGIDRSGEGKVIVSAQIPSPEKMLPPIVTGGGGTDSKRFTLISASSDTVKGAFDALQTGTFRELVLHQNKCIIIGEDEARRGVAPILDFLWRNPRAPSQALVFVTDGSTAKEVLTPEPAQQTLAGLQFLTMAQSPLKSDRVYFVPIWLFQQKYFHSGKDPFASLLRFDRLQRTYVCSGIAVFDGDRMSGKLSASETQMFGLLTNMMKSGGLTIKNAQAGETVSMETVQARTSIKVRKGAAGPVFLVNVRVSGVISEIAGSTARLSSTQAMDIEKWASLYFKSRLEAVIRRLQDYHADVIDFGEQLRVQQPALWRRMDWKKTYPNVSFRVIVKVHVLGDGAVD